MFPRCTDRGGHLVRLDLAGALVADSHQGSAPALSEPVQTLAALLHRLIGENLSGLSLRTRERDQGVAGVRLESIELAKRGATAPSVHPTGLEDGRADALCLGELGFDAALCDVLLCGLCDVGGELARGFEELEITVTQAIDIEERPEATAAGLVEGLPPLDSSALDGVEGAPELASAANSGARGEQLPHGGEAGILERLPTEPDRLAEHHRVKVRVADAHQPRALAEGAVTVGAPLVGRDSVRVDMAGLTAALIDRLHPLGVTIKVVDAGDLREAGTLARALHHLEGIASALHPAIAAGITEEGAAPGLEVVQLCPGCDRAVWREGHAVADLAGGDRGVLEDRQRLPEQHTGAVGAGGRPAVATL